MKFDPKSYHRNIVGAFVAGKTVADFTGSDRHETAGTLIDVGASHVHLVAAEEPYSERIADPGKVTIGKENALEPWTPLGNCEIAFVDGRFLNHLYHLIQTWPEILSSYRTVIVARDGDPYSPISGNDLWGHLLRRDLLGCFPQEDNGLLIYGAIRSKQSRPRCMEERRAKRLFWPRSRFKKFEKYMKRERRKQVEKLKIMT